VIPPHVRKLLALLVAAGLGVLVIALGQGL